MSRDERAEQIISRHLRAGWWALGFYLLLGVVLEALHATKAGFYLDVGSEARRLLFRLAHAHGTLLALINVLFALTARASPAAASPLASGTLLAALVLLPGGFLLGGIWAQGGDPGVGALLAPAGAAALAIGVGAVARRVG
jgi:hypothetical protein